jgi:DNA-binding GntR family transcriptional regulator
MTRTEWIQQDITGKILAGTLAPGTALDEHALAAAYGVSRTPVREALRLLAASGLVAHRAHRGAVVTEPTADDLSDMFAVMADLESLCAGHAARAMKPAARQALHVLHDGMATLVRDGDSAAYAAENERFHAMLYDGSGNRYLADLTLQTRQRLRPFRRAQFDGIGRLAGSHAEHGAIVQAVLRGDVAGAQRLMAAHITVVRDAYLSLKREG